MNIQKILGDKYLERFRVFNPSTLFPPNWDCLLKGRCPLCENKLKTTRKGNIAYCRGKKHKKSFVITVAKLSLIEFNYRDGLPTI